MATYTETDADSHFIQVETPKASRAVANKPPLFTLEWSHVTLKVTTKNNETNRKEEKIILDNVSGFAHPGQLLVMMGPSGAGKSSLLDCISGRKDVRDGLEGSVTVNDQPWTKHLKQQTSYVVQDDLFYETITVQEHLMFQAQLRMGNRVSLRACEKRIDEVMEQLGLVKCRNTLIGRASLRGISGGERKRLSFATEILTNPSLLFVDEPTSGLDSFMAEIVMKQLQRIARDGNRTVIATVHQPSSELFVLFDQLYLLSDGACVYDEKRSAAFLFSEPYFSSSSSSHILTVTYAMDKPRKDKFHHVGKPPASSAFTGRTTHTYIHTALSSPQRRPWGSVLDRSQHDGPASNAVEYFSSLGFPCPAYVSPTDYFMRQLVVVYKATDAAGVARADALKAATVDDTNEKPKVHGFEDNRLKLLGQLRVVLSRNVLSLFRDKTRFHAEVVQSLVVSILMGLVYLQLDMNQRALQNFTGAFFYFVANEIFAAVEIQLASLPLEIPMVRRE